MRTRVRVAWNILANTSGVLVNMLAVLVVMPYLIQRLGASTYGLWSLIGSMTGYLGVLDFGVRPAVGRLIAAHRARGEQQQVNAVISTAFGVLLLVSILVGIATIFAVQLFPRIFPVPSAQALDVHHALVLVGLMVAVTFPASVFDGFLWGYERFDLITAIEIPATVVRTALFLTVVSRATPLTSLAAIVTLVTIGSACLKALLCFGLEPDLRLGGRHFAKSKVREIYSYGAWMSFISWSRTLIPQIGPTIIGHRLGTAAVTSFAVARQLVGSTDVLANSATQVLAPRTIAAHATRSDVMQEQLFIEGGKLSSALSLYFFGGLLCLGMPFIHRWQHGLQDASYAMMVVLMLGELLPISQWLTYSVIIGCMRHKALAWLAVCECAMLVPLAWSAAGSAEVRGVCYAIALSAFLVRGLVRWIYGCRLVNVRLLDYVARVFAPVAAAAALPIAALYLAVRAAAPQSYSAIFGLGAAYSVLFSAMLGFTLLGLSRLRSTMVLFLPQLRRLQ